MRMSRNLDKKNNKKNKAAFAKTAFAGCLFFGGTLTATAAPAVTTKAVAENYANIAHARFEDALTTAQALRTAVENLVKQPSGATLETARKAWKAARPSYQQTEVFRFGNKLVDDWEGKVNAWPLDEGLIDYVDTGKYGTENEENPLYTANIIANRSLKINGKTVDVSNITPDLLESLQEAGGVEANVTTGYHAIEFMLWGQDLHGTGPGAGERPATDFDIKNCTHGHCDRRAAYLLAATNLLVRDLQYMVPLWAKGGKLRIANMAGDGAAGVKALLTGMGSLSYGELAGERIKLGLMLHDPEEEHDCFSDNTHNSHYYDGLGIQDAYLGTYKRVDGSVIKGAALADLVQAKDAKINQDLIASLKQTMADMTVMKKRAESTEAYDQMIAEGNKEGNAIIQKIVDDLAAQTKNIQRVLAVLNIKDVKIGGSDSLK